MTKVVFVVPEDGSEVVGPKLNWLRGLVMDQGDDFWSSGSGQGWLKHSSGAQLLLAFNSAHGFYLEYIEPDRDYWISLSGSNPKRKIVLWIGGNPIIVAGRFFVSRQSAWKAVKELCATGFPAQWDPKLGIHVT